MVRTDYDEIWEKQTDGSMKLLSQVEHVISDEEIAWEQRPKTLRALAAKPTLTPTEVREMLQLLVSQIFPNEE